MVRHAQEVEIAESELSADYPMAPRRALQVLDVVREEVLEWLGNELADLLMEPPSPPEERSFWWDYESHRGGKGR